MEVGERQVNFTWSPAILTRNNTTITIYTLSCSPSPSSLPLHLSQPASLTLTGFTPDTTYTCSVVTNESIGYERPADTTFTTQQDCKSIIWNNSSHGFLSTVAFIQLHLKTGVITSCSEYVVCAYFLLTNILCSTE